MKSETEFVLVEHKTEMILFDCQHHDLITWRKRAKETMPSEIESSYVSYENNRVIGQWMTKIRFVEL